MSEGLTIVCEQLFSRRGLGYLWEHRTELDPAQESILQSLWNNKKKASLTCQQSITYRLSSKRAGRLGFGRLYGTKGSLETLERECRGTLCRDYYHDIDIVNCHPVLAIQLAKRLFQLDLPEVENYCENRDDYLSQVSSNREEAKQAIIKILYHGRNPFPFLEKFQKEMKDFTKRLIKVPEYQELWEACQSEDNKYGSFLSFVLQTEERKIMLCMRDFFTAKRWSVDVLAYDGVMLRKDPTLLIDDSLLEEATKHIEEKTGYKIRLINKEFSYYTLPVVEEEIAQGITRSVYETEKAKFEENHFYYVPTNQIAEVRDGSVVLYDIEHAKELFRTIFIFKKSEKFGDYTPLLDIWRSDLSKRTIQKIDFKPTDNPSVFVLPIQWAYLQSQINTNASKAIQSFKELISINTNHNTSHSDYILRYIAHLLQRPFELPRTALLFIGNQGAGKDMLWDFIGAKIIGFNQYIDYGKNSQFFAPHDCGSQDKLLVKLQEADPSFCRRFASDLKSIISGPYLTFNPKGKKEYCRENYLRLVLTTNKGNPLELEQSDRRWVIFTNSNELCGNYPKIKQIVSDLFEDAGAAAAVSEFLLTYPLGDFHPEKDKPENEFKKQVLETEKSAEERFIEQWDGSPTAAAQLFILYRDYCQLNQLPHCQNAQSLGKRLLKLLATGALLKSKREDAMIYTKPP